MGFSRVPKEGTLHAKLLEAMLHPLLYMLHHIHRSPRDRVWHHGGGGQGLAKLYLRRGSRITDTDGPPWEHGPVA